MGAPHFLDTRVSGGAGAVQLEAAMEGLAASGSAGKEPGLVRCPRGSLDIPMACIRGHSVSNGASCWSGDTSTSSTAFADRTDETSFSLLPVLPRPLSQGPYSRG